MNPKVTQEALLEAARRHQRRPGINPRVAAVLAYAELVGHSLDPEAFDDAAVILRAIQLMDELPVVRALQTACAELVASRGGKR